MRSDVPVGVCLSGGLDSSTITSIISHTLGNDQVHTFSAVYAKGETGDETEYISLYREQLTNMHFTSPQGADLLSEMERFVYFQSEPLPSTGPFAQYCVMKLARENVVVTLDGQGADEVLGGYHYFYGFYYKELLRSFKIATLLKEMFLSVKRHRSLFGLQTFVFFLLPKSLQMKIRVDERGYVDKHFAGKSEKMGKSVIIDDLYSSKDLKTSLINHLEYKLEHLLKWNDKNSMYFSIESRTPFLDYRLIEYTLSLPSDVIIRNGMTKYILRESMKGILPERIRLRQDKIGFATPEDDWFRLPEFQRYTKELLASDAFRNRKIIDPEKAMKLYEKHLKGEINISKDIWKWINLELWFRLLIDK